MTTLSTNEWHLVNKLSQMPFIDTIELTFLSDLTDGKVSYALKRLEEEDLANSILHTTPLTDPSRRYYLTRKGVRLFLDHTGVSRSETTLPISREWYLSLLRRLDSVRTVYRIARYFVPADRDTSRETPRVIWYRQGNWDAALRFHDGNVVPILFQGKYWGEARFIERISELHTYDEGDIGGVLFVTPDAYSANRALHKLRTLGSSLPAYACAESEVLLAKSQQDFWYGMARTNHRFDSLDILLTFRKQGRLHPIKPAQRANLPWVAIPEAHLVWSSLKQAEKRYLALIAKCIFIRVEDLQAIDGIGLSMHKTILSSLTKFGLIERLAMGGERRVTLSDLAIRLICYRDRRAYHHALKERSCSLRGDGKFLGSELRDAANKLTHDDNVHAVIGLFSQHARQKAARFEFDVSRHLHRKYPDASGRDRQLSPDAQICLYGVEYYFVEVEFSASSSKQLKAKLKPYIDYYRCRKWEDDLRVEPATLFIFRTPAMAKTFLDIAYEECRLSGVFLPLGVTDIETVRSENSVSSRLWMARATLTQNRRYSLEEKRHFRA